MLLLGVFLLGVPLLWAQSGTPTKKVAILEVVDRDNTVNYGVKLLLRTTLARAITQTQGYEGYERVDMEAIQGEQDFQRTGMVSDEQIKRLGVMTGADYVLVAEVAKIDAANMLVTAKILDVETAKLERTDYEQMGMSSKEMSEGCRKIARRLLVKNDTIRLDPDSKVVRKGARLFVEDKYMIRNKMSEEWKQSYLGDYYKPWIKAQRQWRAGVCLMSCGAPLFVGGASWLLIAACTTGIYYEGTSTITFEAGCAMGLMAGGAVFGMVGVSLAIEPNRQMKRILQKVNEQHGIAPYRTAASLHIGSQPHGVGLGIRF